MEEIKKKFEKQIESEIVDAERGYNQTENEIFYQKCGMLEVVEGVMYNLRGQHCELLDEVCEIMNNIFVSHIKDLGFPNAHFSIDVLDCEPELLLCFEERCLRNTFATEEKWMDYQIKNIETCNEYLQERCPSLHIICLPRKEYET